MDPHGPTAAGGSEPTKEAARPGLVMSGKYRLISEIGRGGMGSVWRAEHLGWQAPVAIKVMTRDVTGHPEALARFEREVRLAAGLRSPHVVQVLDHGIDAATGTPFIAMELLEGESLARRLKRMGSLSPAETFRIVSQLVRALSRAHAAGIVHRDLKPDNVFLVRNDDETIAKVLDFGVAKWTTPSLPRGGLTRPGSVLGTPFYMSPEQIQGSREIDHRADLWSLAAIACECLTGRRPFAAPDFAQLAVLLLTPSARPLPSSLGPVPSGFDAWFQRATAQDIARRFQSAREMAQTLASVCGTTASSFAPESYPATEEAASGREVPSMAPVSHTASFLFLPGRLWRRPWARFAISLLAGLVVTGGALAFWFQRGPAPGALAHPPTSASAASAPQALTHALEAAPPSAPAPEPTPAGVSPGVRVVREPEAAPAGADMGADEPVESGAGVTPPKKGVESDRAAEPSQPPEPGSPSKRATARSGRSAKASTPRKAKPSAARATSSTSSKAPATAAPAEAAESLDVNGRRIRTSL